VEFTLTYDGSLPTNGRPAQKHAIRSMLHPQLKELWRYRPLLQFEDNAGPNLATVGGYDFCTVVHPRWGFQAKLDILMLRPEPVGGIVGTGGDIDNRLKTLFDALTRPTHAQDIPANWTPTVEETPLHCLLDDDSLIAGFSINVDRLLAAPTSTHVKLFVKVQVLNTTAFGAVAILG
jgi:hypothetical protein